MKTIKPKIRPVLVILTLMLLSLQVFSQNYPAVRIDVVGATSSDQVWVFQVAGTTRGFDNGWDGYKMTGSTAMQIYAAEATGNFQIDAVPDLNNTYIAFKAGSDTQYTMTLLNQYISPTFTALYLVDSVANQTVNIFTSGTTYTFTATNTTAIKRFKLVAVAAPKLPTTTTSVSSLTGFSYVQDSGPSSEQTVSVSGANLIDNLVVTPPADYEISLTSGTGFTSSALSLTPTSGTVASTNIYVRLKSGLAANTYSENIAVSASNIATKTVALTGIVTIPITTISVSSLTGFSYAQGSGPSSEQAVIVSGTNLTGNIILTPPANYEISFTSGTGFTSSALSLTPASGTVASTNIYVRLITGLSANTYTGNIAVSTTNIATKTVSVSGSVTAPPVVHKITITNSGKTVTVKNTDTTKGTLTIYLASTGVLQKTYSFNAKSTTSFNTGLKAGIYVVKGVTGSDTVSATIVI